jgi:hypothetical protein
MPQETPLRFHRDESLPLRQNRLEQAAEKVEEQIPRRPEGLLVMTNSKVIGAAEAAPPSKHSTIEVFSRSVEWRTGSAPYCVTVRTMVWLLTC